MHIINRLYSAEYDYPEANLPPEKSVMIASLPRSGSTIFCEHMWRSGCLGAPMEYPAIPYSSDLYSRRRSDSAEDYWRKVQSRRTSPNGIFSYKIFVNNLLNISREHPGLYRQMEATHIVYMTREDELGQAISHSRAMRSGIWFSGVNRRDQVPYDAEHINKCLHHIGEQKAFWEDVFRKSGTRVHRVTYEAFLRDPEEAIHAVAAFVGVSIDPERHIDIPLISPQRDETTVEWRRRFLADRPPMEAPLDTLTI